MDVMELDLSIPPILCNVLIIESNNGMLLYRIVSFYGEYLVVVD